MKSKILFIISLLFGLVFINAGLNKIFQYMPMPDNIPMEMVDLLTNMLKFGWLLPLIAWVEIIGGILVCIPKTRLVGALALFPIQVGILLTHLNQAPSGLALSLILLAINLWIFIENKGKLLQLLKS